jgi:phospholipid/cholesterol/gamma-HCH transport system permease protein
MITALFSGIGGAVVGIAREAGGIGVLWGRVMARLVPPRLDGRELWRNLDRMGVQSVPIVILTSFFAGAIMVIQSGIIVKRLGAQGLLGWGAGYANFREVAPILIGLMFSGRVGANNTAELGTMTITEQIDGLRTLAIDPISYLIVPRVIAMMVMLFCLTVLGDVITVIGGAITGYFLLGVELSVYYHSLVENLKPWDFLSGVIKSASFGLVISLTSCHFGLSVKGGAVGVGRAVNAAVVAAAVGIMVLDFLLTYLLR